MKIGIDIRNIGKKRTGDEAVFFNLVKNLAIIDARNEYKLLTDISDEKVLDDISRQLGIARIQNFEVVTLASRNRFLWNLKYLPEYLADNPVDIYRTQYITPLFVSRKIKIVTTIHDISFNFFPRLIRWSDLFFLKTLIPLSLERADKIIAVSNFTRDEIIKYYSIAPEKVECVPNAVSDDFREEEITAEKIERTRKKYSLPEKFILYVGTFQPRKNLPRLIEAFAAAKEKLPGIKLVLAGGRNAKNEDREIARSIEKHSLGREVIFTGYVTVEDKVSLYKSALAFISPSLYEGFGIPVLEAMSAGLPVAASDISAHREVAGAAVEFFNPQDTAECSEKILKICKNEKVRNDLAYGGRVEAEKFSWEKSARKTLDIYEYMAKHPISKSSRIDSSSNLA